VTVLALSLAVLGASLAALSSADAAGERLVSRRVCRPPLVDGRVEPLWQQAPVLRLRLTWGRGGEPAYYLVLRSVYTDQDVYFLARWPGSRPTGDVSTIGNKPTVHWRLEPAAEPLAADAPPAIACTVACHTAFTSGDGRLVYANAETIPQGGGEGLLAAGGWDREGWTIEWSRPLLNRNPYDLQFDDLSREYDLFVKVFERTEGRPDPVSDRLVLVFAP